MVNIINIYTDGSRKGKEIYYGGWGTILDAPEHDQRKELYGGLLGASNNQMEMNSVIEGLKAMKTTDADIRIFSDSAYIVNCFRDKWYLGWERNGWITSKNKPVENKAIWQEMFALVKKFRSVTFFHIDGHITLSKPEVVAEYCKKFNEKNRVNFTLEEFTVIARNNADVDKLACKGAEEIRNA